MLKPASGRTFAAVTALVPLAASAALMSACKAPQYPATSPGTQPPIWTGSPAPSSSEPTGQQGGTDSLTTQLNDPNGTKVATAKFDFNPGYVTITIETTGTGQLSPGFHGVHIHSVGKCEAHSVAPTGGEPGDFLSAGGHFKVHDVHASGDLTSLQVRKDGGALLETTTDGFTKADLLAGAGTADHHPCRRRQLRQHPVGPLHPGQRRTRTRPDDDVDWRCRQAGGVRRDRLRLVPRRTGVPLSG